MKNLIKNIIITIAESTAMKNNLAVLKKAFN